MPEPLPDEPEFPEYALYRPGDVAMATLVGTPIAGAIVSGLNSAHLGRPRERWITFSLSVLAVATLIALFWGIPQAASGTIALLAIAIMYKLEKALHGRALAEHVRRGGGHPSTWKAAGIGVLCLVSIIFLAGVYAAGEGELGEEISLVLRALVDGEEDQGEFQEPWWSTLEVPPNDTVYYAGYASPEDARRLARVMAEHGWFGGTGADVYLERFAGETTVSIVLVDEFDSPNTRVWCRQLGEALDDASIGYDITIEIWDMDGAVRNTFPVE